MKNTNKETQNFFDTTFSKVLLGLMPLVIMLLIIFGSWFIEVPKFHDVTVELGTDSVSTADFMTPYARFGKVRLVSDAALVNLNEVGATELVLSHNGQTETVTLTVQDTTAPHAVFTKKMTVPIDYVPDVADFVSDVQDHSKTEIRFLQAPVVPKDYSDVTVAVEVEDACGNAVSGTCTLSYIWLKEAIAVELGELLTAEQVLLDPVRDISLVDQAAIDIVNECGLGEYTISSTLGEKTISCAVTVQDTLGPVLELQDYQARVGGKVELDDFLVSSKDASGVADVRMITEPDTSVEGEQIIVIEAEDTLGNISTTEVSLFVASDFTPPVINGAGKSMSVEKNSSPNYLSGVSAKDDVDGYCRVTCDSSGVNLKKAGTYYVTYRAVDSSGNVKTVKRKVVVKPDAEDTAALVKTIAGTLSNDPEAIRDYVRYTVRYNTNWGGDDPVWYGFTNKVGNCYVHATCLKAIFDVKGIESRLIWVTDKSHYWLIVRIDGTWKHIDATPGVRHTKYSLMNDEMRLATLSGRVWDTSLWPACE